MSNPKTTANQEKQAEISIFKVFVDVWQCYQLGRSHYRLADLSWCNSGDSEESGGISYFSLTSAQLGFLTVHSQKAIVMD